LYNKVIDECVDNPAILVFMRVDILIADYFWTPTPNLFPRPVF